MSVSPDCLVVAKFMQQQLEKTKFLYQDVIAMEIDKRFGDKYTYLNINGGFSIHKKVLAEFKKLNKGNVVWERGEKCWRFRQDYDSSDSRLVD